MIQQCHHCKSEQLLVAEVDSFGIHGPVLLPGTGFFSQAKFKIYVCASCGFVHWFVRPSDLDAVKKSDDFSVAK